MRFDRVQTSLDVAATIAMIVASAAIVYAIVLPKRSDTGPRARTPASERRMPAAPLPLTPVSLDGAPSQGKIDASVGVIEYSDFECPFCASFQQGTYGEVVQDYVETGRVRFAFRHLPLERRHRSALRAAEAAECSARQAQFWPMHDQLFAIPMALDPDSLTAKAQRIGLDMRLFNECMKGGALERIRRDIVEARSLAVHSTPTFFFGKIEADGRLKVMRRESGALEANEFAAILDQLLGLSALSPSR